jgi:D-glycero-beta-D-manno-heptose 1-phosphate adenylyltransferase
MEKLTSKIVSDPELSRIIARAQFIGKKIVFTNGCFDIIHRGHVEYLLKAAKLGNMLIVGLNTDSSVKKLKGTNRPLQDQETRSRVLASMYFVNYVVLFGEDTPYELIKVVRPDILVKGGDYKPEDIVGYDIVTKYGGQVTTIPLIKGYSTSSVIKKLSK